MGLFRRNATTVGLDIGSGLIKLVAISHASGGPVITKVAFATVGNDAIGQPRYRCIEESCQPRGQPARSDAPVW